MIKDSALASNRGLTVNTYREQTPHLLQTVENLHESAAGRAELHGAKLLLLTFNVDPLRQVFSPRNLKLKPVNTV